MSDPEDGRHRRVCPGDPANERAVPNGRHGRDKPGDDGPVTQTIPHAFGFRPGIDLDKLNQLIDELEAEAYAAGQRRSQI